MWIRATVGKVRGSSAPGLEIASRGDSSENVISIVYDLYIAMQAALGPV
jgi:hypothetical protein